MKRNFSRIRHLMHPDIKPGENPLNFDHDSKKPDDKAEKSPDEIAESKAAQKRARRQKRNTQQYVIDTQPPVAYRF